MGKILLQGEALKTECIPEEQCDGAIDDFCDMHDCATKANDKFYAEEKLYGEYDAPIYRYFQDWPTFIKRDYAKGVSLNSYNRLKTVFVQNPNLVCVESEEQFNELDDPKAFGGFRIPDYKHGMLVDVETWKRWREEWYCKHQELVEWNDWDNDFFVNKDINDEIIRNEVRGFIAAEQNISFNECTDDKINKAISAVEKCHIDGDLDKPLAENALTIYFHRIVMASYACDGDRQGYLKEIGSKICEANYYIELPDLSAMEKAVAPAGRSNTQRNIWGIKNNQEKWKFISFDFEKGMFEFHNDSGNHLGEYMFDGTRNAAVQNDHSLRCVAKWKDKNHI